MPRVLIVDDEPDIRTLVRIALERSGDMEVVAVGSGAEAIDAAGATDFDLVLLDVMMPGMDGIETLAHLRDLPGGDDTVVVFLTARTQDRDLARYAQAGVAATLTKPFEPKALVEQVRTLIEGAA